MLQNTATDQLYTFSTTSATGRRAVGNLLREYNRMLNRGADQYPVVRLRAGGFNHKDTRIGWVHTPVFAVVGRKDAADTAKPDTSPAADLNDEIPL